MQAKPGRQTPIIAGACDSYNVMLKYTKNIKTPTEKQQQRAHNALLHHHQPPCLRTAKPNSRHHSV